MKMIHCADIHLDSKMRANLDEDKAKERKQELLKTFQKMIDYADVHGVTAILIAGDLFDTKIILKTTKNVVLREIENHPNITFYYLRGNHDVDNFLSDLEVIPENLKLFTDEWTSYDIGQNIRISGIELTNRNASIAYTSHVFDIDKVNIVMLHGQEADTGNKDRTEVINLRALQNKGIDYLALGHIHAYKEAPLDARGWYCYSGCLEGRGFDECGTHGFVLLDIDESTKTIKREFVPYAIRTLYTIPVDVTGCMESVAMLEKIREQFDKGKYPPTSLVKLVLTGELDVECEKNIDYIKTLLDSDFYFIKIEDQTRLKVDIDQYRYDVSLKGEFIRNVTNATDLKEEDKNEIIRYGLKILNREEV